MAEKHELHLTKLYYSIGEVGEMFKVNTSLLRFWEKEFRFDIAKKNLKGNRLYSVKEIRKIEQIYQLVKIEGYTLEGAKTQLNKGKKSLTFDTTPSNDELIDRLEHVKKKLISLKTL
jgi:DNA-binding transcriptional MerR regulator